MTASESVADARRRLVGVGREALGELVTRRLFGIPRAPRIEPRGSAWHLGALLLTDDAVLATGDIVRAREEARRGFTAESQRMRAHLSAAARRGGFAEGQIVHIGWHRIDVDDLSDPRALIALRAGVPSIRWTASGGYMPLQRYLDERVELLRHPPVGAN